MGDQISVGRVRVISVTDRVIVAGRQSPVNPGHGANKKRGREWASNSRSPPTQKAPITGALFSLYPN
jgi:hypothetical protein